MLYRRRLLLWLVLAMVLSGGMSAQEETDLEPRADLDAMLEAYLEVWSSGELDRLDDIVSDDFMRHAGPAESPRSRQGLKDLIRDSRQLYRNPRFEVEDLFVVGERGAMQGKFWGGYKDTDRAVHFPVMALYRFEEGRLAEEWILANNVSTLIALSFTIAPPGYKILPPEADGEARESRLTTSAGELEEDRP